VLPGRRIPDELFSLGEVLNLWDAGEKVSCLVLHCFCFGVLLSLVVRPSSSLRGLLVSLARRLGVGENDDIVFSLALNWHALGIFMVMASHMLLR
jgi:hypothetical protein